MQEERKLQEKEKDVVAREGAARRRGGEVRPRTVARVRRGWKPEGKLQTHGNACKCQANDTTSRKGNGTLRSDSAA